jgi:hypothetical protein
MVVWISKQARNKVWPVHLPLPSLLVIRRISKILLRTTVEILQYCIPQQSVYLLNSFPHFLDSSQVEA